MNWLYLIAVIICAPLAYMGIKKVYIDVYQAWRVWQSDNQHLQQQALECLMHIPADENARLGIIIKPNGNIISLDTGRVFNETGLQYADAIAELVDARIRALIASHNVPGGAEAIQQLPEQTLPKLPTQISIQDVLGTRTPTLDALTIGVTLNEQGELIPVTRSLYELMHLLAIGITGSGKSTWLLSFLAEVEMCRETIEVLLIDVHGSAFNLCSDWSKLRYPVARNNEQAKTLLEAVRVESDRRADLYEAVPLAEDLASYNAHAEQPLDPWLVVIDEGTLMLADKSISDYVATSVQGTRQYGLYVFMTGQTGNAEVVRSPIRANFPTRICYTTEAPSMRAALGENPPGELEEIPGRGWVRLNGRRTPIKIQAPYIRRQAFYEMIEHSGPKLPMPARKSPSTPDLTDGFTDEHILETWQNLPKQNKSRLCQALGEEPVGGFFYRIDSTGRRLGLWE